MSRSRTADAHLNVGWLLATPVILTLLACSPTTAPDISPDAPAGPAWEERLQELALSLNIEDPPDVAPIRFVSPSESKGAIDGCLQDEGWPISPDGSFEIAAEQAESYDLSYYTCAARYPVADRYLQPFTAEQWGVVYDHWRDHFYPCLDEHGLAAPQLISRETFLDSPTSWHPNASNVLHDSFTASRPGEDFNAFLVEGCPISPPDSELYGG